MDKLLVSRWRGTSVSGASSKRMAADHTDYERACAVKNYLGRIELNGSNVLVLGDMPLETSVWKLRGHTTIVRLFYADATADFEKLLVGVNDEVFAQPIESIVCTVSSDQMELFDSAVIGSDNNKNSLVFDISPGVFSVLTVIANPNERTSFLLHKFFPIS